MKKTKISNSISRKKKGQTLAVGRPINDCEAGTDCFKEMFVECCGISFNEFLAIFEEPDEADENSDDDEDLKILENHNAAIMRYKMTNNVKTEKKRTLLPS